MQSIKKGGSSSDRTFHFIVYLVVVAFAVFCFIPFWIVVINSFSDTTILNIRGYQIFVSKFSLDAYRYLFSGKQVYTSYGVSLFQTIVGTALAVLITTMFAYTVSHKKVKYSGILSFMAYIVMIFGSGLVGFYLVVANWLHLKDSIWALIFPYLMNPFNVFLCVSFFRENPYEIYESATIDGANDISIFFRIILPISKPGIATITLFYALQYWNDWWLSLLFIDDNRLHSLQMMLRELMSSVNASQYVVNSSQYIKNLPSEGFKLAMVCVTIGPIVLLYPFIQKYFVKGITLGSVKG